MSPSGFIFRLTEFWNQYYGSVAAVTDISSFWFRDEQRLAAIANLKIVSLCVVLMKAGWCSSLVERVHWRCEIVNIRHLVGVVVVCCKDSASDDFSAETVLPVWISVSAVVVRSIDIIDRFLAHHFVRNFAAYEDVMLVLAY